MKGFDKKTGVLIFFVSALLLGFYGVIEIMELPVGKRGQVVEMRFDHVTGLTTADPVSVKGIEVGRVKDISLKDNAVIVRVWLEKSLVLHEDARASIRSIGMIGEKYIDLIPGQSEFLLAEGKEIIGVCDADLAESGKAVNQLIQTTQTLMMQLSAGIDSLQIASMQQSAAAAVYNIEQLSAQSRETLSRLNRMIQISDDLLAAHHEAIDSSMTAFETAGQQLPRITVQADSLLRQFNELAADLKAGRGTAGRLITEDSLYGAVFSTVANLDSLIVDVQKNPGRYIKASLF